MRLNDFWELYRRKLVVGLGFFLIVLSLGFGVGKLTSRQPPGASQRTEDSFAIENEHSAASEEAIEELYYADIKGGVKEPGMYQISTNTRLADLIELAGGLTPEAETEVLNLALLIQDQMLVYIPEVGKESPVEDVVISLPETTATSSKININTADVTELQGLNGIGPKKAEAILAYREEHGSFKTIEEIMKVSGIGEKTFENLKEDLAIK